MRDVEVGSGWQRSAARISSGVWRKANVAMLHAGRCGSTVVAEMLGEHPRVVWAGEIFEQAAGSPDAGRPGFAKEQIEHSLYATLAPVYGFETKYLAQQHLSPDCVAMSLDEYVALLRSLRFDRFILLHRRNYLRRTISALVGRQKGEWHSETGTGAAAATRVHVDVDQLPTGNEFAPLVKTFEGMDDAYASLQRLLAHERVLTLTYEDDILANPTIAYRKVCEFLDIEPGQPPVRLQKTNPFSIDEMVDNVDDVRIALSGTPYEWMLDD